jgi:hypothetical protein
VLEGTDIAMTDSQIKVPGYAHPIDLAVDDPYPEMLAPPTADGRRG